MDQVCKEWNNEKMCVTWGEQLDEDMDKGMWDQKSTTEDMECKNGGMCNSAATLSATTAAAAIAVSVAILM